MPDIILPQAACFGLHDDSVLPTDQSLISFVDNVILSAHNQLATDIHIEPFNEYYRIRFRLDGILYSTYDLPATLGLRLITRLKILAKMDIAESRVPQDGNIELKLAGKAFPSIRASTCPSIYGEKIVLRLFNTLPTGLSLTSLGLSQKQISIFSNALAKPYGLIISSGPTGCGKTFTLYTALNHLNASDKNIITIEDPVEMKLEGITQININPKINLGFASILRAVLRQDPDIIFIGEIRDKETARIAIQAAQTGHLVLASVHAPDSFSTVRRLHMLGISSDQLLDVLILVISQRLVRKKCKACETGCPLCHAGYKGRTGIYEVIPINHKTYPIFLNHHSNYSVETKLNKYGITNLYQTGIEKVSQGITRFSEITRVLGYDASESSL